MGVVQRSPSDDEKLGATLPAERPSRPQPLSSQEMLGDSYRIIRQLGRGGMGIVYVVEHIELGRHFAAKVVDKEQMSERAMQRLLKEARVTSAIRHENIVDVVFAGRQSDGSVFVVMELLEGEDLSTRLARQRASSPKSPWIPTPELTIYVPQILEGLHAAHQAGVVHRDLKPENIFLSRQDSGDVVVKLVDFGIATESDADNDFRLTQTGQIVGTPLYMAPEQARGARHVDRRADIYSFGVILYELMTGDLPFEGESLFDLMVKRATQPPRRPSELRPDLGQPLERVIMRCLERDPDHRFPNAMELRKAWDGALQGALLPPSPSIPAIDASGSAADGPRLFVAAFAATAVVVTSLGVGGWWLLRDPEPAPPASPVSQVSALPPDEDPVPIPTANPAAAVEDAVPPAPATFERLVESDPPGAHLMRGNTDLGQTPQRLTLAEGETAEVELVLDGYQTEHASVSGESPETVTVTLERARRVRRRGRSRPAAATSGPAAETSAPSPPPAPNPQRRSILVGQETFEQGLHRSRGGR